MQTRRQRHLTAAASLVAGVLVLGVMAVLGYRSLTAPFSSSKEPQATGCPAGQHEVVRKVLRRGEVVVSVYNASGIKGAAGRTMAQLERAGFRAGEVGNAPEDMQFQGAKVYTTDADGAAAELVARYLGKRAQVVHSDEEFGPGVDVFMGKHPGKPVKKAKRTITLKDPVRSCVKDG